jgi:transposase
MSNVTIAVDTAKNVFEIAISAAAGRIQERRRMTRHQFERFWSTREPCRVVMEGCSGSHYWAACAACSGNSASPARWAPSGS